MIQQEGIYKALGEGPSTCQRSRKVSYRESESLVIVPCPLFIMETGGISGRGWAFQLDGPELGSSLLLFGCFTS